MIVIAALIAFLSGFVLTRSLVKALSKRGVVDVPNERSSHTVTTPRGGGIAIIATLTAGLVALYFSPQSLANDILVITALALALALVSIIDDVRPLSPGPRFIAQFAAVLAALSFLPSLVSGPLLALPYVLAIAFVAFGWLWFLNLFNFMDGIDGIAGVETIAICVGLLAVHHLQGSLGEQAPVIVILAAATAGFLIFNWAPAKIFMGDVGSIPIGFILGWLLFDLAASGAWAAALILPMYYLVDATLTLARRAARGEKIWRAHREHYYQQAVQGGMSHSAVSLRIALLNAILIGLAIWSATSSPWFPLALSLLMVAGMLYHLANQGRRVA